MGQNFRFVLMSTATLKHAALVLCCVASFVALASYTFDRLLLTQNQKELQAITKSIVTRTETSIDYAVLSAFEVLEKTSEPCSEAGQAALRRIVHSRSFVKDIRILAKNGDVLCAAFPDVSTKKLAVALGGNGQTALNSDYALHSVEVAGRNILGVEWQYEKTNSILVAIDLDAQLFDSLPPSIRDFSSAILSIGKKHIFAQSGQTIDHSKTISASTSTSKRYPISVETAMAVQNFAAWNNDNRNLVLAIAALAGLIIGGFWVRELRRPASPRTELESAVAREEFIPYYQAKFCLKSKAIIGCEVLMRWKKADGTVVPPNNFIPLAEATNMIVPMTRTVTKRALFEMREYMLVDRAFKLAINITPMDFMAPRFADEMLSIVEEHGILPNQIILELTERQGLEDVATLRDSIKRARGFGFKVALDDMGTGHNGLSHLQDIGIDIIKIDKKFVDFIGQEPTADAIVDLLVNLATRLGMTTLAEGIETEAQRLALLKAGVEMGQGYLVGKPVPIIDFTASLLRHLLEVSGETEKQLAA